MAQQDKLITIYSTFNPGELSLIKMRLQSFGIRFFIQNENFGALYPGTTGLSMAQVQVIQSDIERVKSLLQDIIKENKNISPQEDNKN